MVGTARRLRSVREGARFLEAVLVGAGSYAFHYQSMYADRFPGQVQPLLLHLRQPALSFGRACDNDWQRHRPSTHEIIR